MASVTDLLKSGAEVLGVNFHCEFTSAMTARRLTFPLLWTEPASVLEKTGYREGYIRYLVKSYLFTEGRNGADQNAAELFEDYLKRLHSFLDHHESVFGVTLAEHRILPHPLTNYGEKGMYAEWKIDLIFKSDELWNY